MKKITYTLISIIVVLILVAGQCAAASAAYSAPTHNDMLRPMPMNERENWSRSLDVLMAGTGFLKHEVSNCITSWGAIWESDLYEARLTGDPVFMECNEKYETLCDLVRKWGFEVDRSRPQEEFKRILSEGNELSEEIESLYQMIVKAEATLPAKKDTIPSTTYPSLNTSMRMVRELIEFATWSAKAFIQHQGCDMIGKPDPIDIRTRINVSSQYFKTVSEYRELLTVNTHAPAFGLSSVFIDRGICLAIVNNLIRNSCEVARRNGRNSVIVTMIIKSNPLTGGVIVEYSDNGPGFVNKDGQALEKPEIVFEAGFTTKGDPNNHGMGLAIVRTQLEAIGASIKPLKNPSRPGAIFEIRFPPCAPTMEQFLAKSASAELNREAI